METLDKLLKIARYRSLGRVKMRAPLSKTLIGNIYHTSKNKQFY